MKAAILCRGSRVPFRYRYSGAPSCRTAALMAVRPKACGSACLGFGDCVRACPRRAIQIEEGIARIDPSRCDGCGKCEESCPLSLIALIPAEGGFAVLCKESPGPSGDSVCPEGCTACGLCVDACPETALERTENGIPQWIEDRCNGCGLCVEACPQEVILLQGSPATAMRRPCHPNDAADHPSNSM